MCCDPIDYREDEIDGKCKACGNDTVQGDAFEQCGYSPVECPDCNWKPCDGSC